MVEVYNINQQQLIATINLPDNGSDLIVDQSLNKGYAICYDKTLKAINLGTNTISQSLPLNKYAYMITKVGNKLCLSTRNDSDSKYYLDLYDINTLQSTGSILVNESTGYQMSTDNQNLLFYPCYPNKKNQIIDVSKPSVVAETGFSDYVMALSYDSVTNRVYSAGSNSVKYIENSSVAVAYQKQDASCGLANGSITLTVPTDGRTFSYRWSNGSITKDLTAISAGVYSVTVSAQGTCSNVLSISVNQVGLANISHTITPTTSELCAGATVLLQAMTNQTYQWIKDGILKIISV